ncbi:sulfotransferase [Rubrivirga sp. IMCC45206]|uniref:sulfotransferase n=1 Tax=Rubrivirga sp. IMCC45206 TaxID=3391614 RepID=UPI00398FFC03
MPPLFVVGSPRSGTTVVTQHIFNTFEFAYISNYVKKHFRIPAIASVISRLKGVSNRAYDSRLGVVKGETSISDGWALFEQWFPGFNYHDADGSGFLRTANPNRLAALLRFIERIYSAPVLVKNNGNSLRIDSLSNLFQSAIFVHVERDLVSTSSSLIRARHKRGVGKGDWWTTVPEPILSLSFESEAERAVVQSWAVREAARRSLTALSPDRYITIEYDAFCDDPDGVIRWVEAKYLAHAVRLKRVSNCLDPTIENRAPPPLVSEADVERFVARAKRQLAAT